MSTQASSQQPLQKLDAYNSPPPQFSQQLIHQQLSYYNNDSDQSGVYYNINLSQDRYFTLESSSLSSVNYGTMYDDSPSTVAFSPNGSCSLSQQESQSYPEDNYTSPPISGSCVSVTQDMNDRLIMHKLKELETVMLGPDLDFLETYDDIETSSLLASAEIESWRQMMIPKGDLKDILIACAMSVSNNDLLMAQRLISELRPLVSVSGEPIQRLGAYMLEGLVAKLSASGGSVHKSLKFREPASFELLSYMHILHEVCPYFKFGYMSANGAIAEAVKNEVRVHIIDFQIGQGSQWVPLIQAFAARPGGPPCIRLTGIDDSISAYARGGGLNIVGRRLSKLAETFKVPFEFRSVGLSGCQVLRENLVIRQGEPLVVNFAFMLHRMPDESVSTENHRDRLLRMVKGLNPKVVTLVEQEFNTNTAAFYPRLVEALDYYTAMFESIDVALPREHKERIKVEQHCLARDVVNIIACEGRQRVERHELVGKWKSRFKMAGFSPYPSSSLVNATIKELLGNYSEKYRVEERDGALYLGWLKRDLVAACAWK